MGVVLKDHLALGGQRLKLFEDGIGTVGHPLRQLPLGGVGHRHPDQGLIGLQPIKRQSQVITPQDNHRSRPGAVLVGAHAGGYRRGKNLTTGRAAQLLQRVAHRRQQGMAVDPNLDAGRQRI